MRHLDIQAASKLVIKNLNALKGPSAETVLALFFEIVRTARLEVVIVSARHRGVMITGRCFTLLPLTTY